MARPTHVHVWPLYLPLPHQIWPHVEPEIQWVLPRKCRAPVPVQAERQGFRLRFLLSTLLLSIRELLYTILAGVPGFEPGLSVLETDVLTVDTIPLLTLPMADLPMLTACLLNRSRKSAMVSVTWFPYDPCAYGSDYRTS